MPNRRYWLMKTEPDVFSIDDLAACPDQTTPWEGVRNYQSRNFMRDEMSIGDGVLFYHSRANPLAVAGTARIASDPYPDPSQFDPGSNYFDEKATEENPRWYLVDVQLVHKFEKPVLRDDIKNEPELADMMVIRRGARLSIQPVTRAEWDRIHQMAGVKQD
jgi:predicted RNA-binding protein with PUA-like domain